MQSLPRHPSYDAEPAYEPVRCRRWLALAGVLAVVAVCCLLGDRWSEAPLAHVGQTADLALSGGGSWRMGDPSGLSVHITGAIEGAVDVWVDNWEPQRLTGRVDWRVYHDWLYPTGTLHYRPLGKVSGRLVIRYQFH
jgi:hypothetical protein